MLDLLIYTAVFCGGIVAGVFIAKNNPDKVFGAASKLEDKLKKK